MLNTSSLLCALTCPPKGRPARPVTNLPRKRCLSPMYLCAMLILFTINERRSDSNQEAIPLKKITTKKIMADDKRRERGAALLTVLLLATLLLSAGGALVLTTTLSSTNAIDSSAEMQAYYSAEAGLQATINTLRGNVYNDSSTPAASFRAVVEPSLSNATGDAATAQNIARLSKWFTYNSNKRIVMPGTNNLIAYDVTARDL